MKKDWFFFPFNLLFKSMGGIPVNRDRRTSLTDQVVEMFQTNDRFQVAITPEGTRKRVDEWKKGFYYIALKAHVPILLAYIDYGKKTVGIKEIFYPTGNADQDIAIIREKYNGIRACHPEHFGG